MNSPRSQLVTRELSALMRLAVPIAAAQAGQTLMSLVDVWIVGELGARPLGAIGLANSTFFFVGTLGLGTVMGLDPFIAQALGAGDPRRARRLLWQGVWLALACSAVIGALLLLAPLVLGAMRVPEETAHLTNVCLQIRIASVPAFLLF